ncbi:PH domain-containing protein [Natrialba aegyptia]|uniref:Membrane-flanked domain-containing protein n=1 Tax=Natrialba aegyptia DSM 13077 TaxID=1227491 RepID=M0BLC4_9EURY|nr:PH domain-containing protein [Natrialba aegyptia]ELZ10419.1 membrane-flanked domain-containing protein [Natrialba aegyptia DSM 13077]
MSDSLNRLHPLSAVTYALQHGFVWLWIPVTLLLVLAGVFDPIRAGWIPFVAPVGFLAGVAYGVVYYYRFGYAVTPDTVDVSSGVVARRSREIPYRRIQNVDIKQGVIQRVLGLAVVSIETAGGGDSEATLNFVGEAEATRLQREIRRRTADSRERRRSRDEQTAESEATTDASELADTGPSGDSSSTPVRTPDSESSSPSAGPEPSEAGEPGEPSDTGTDEFSEQRRQPLFALQPRELLLYSFTSVRAAAVAGVMFVFFLATDSIFGYLLTVAEPVGGPADLGSGTVGSYGVLTLVSLLNGIGVTYVLSVAYTFGTYYDFQLGRVGDDFVYERGLLQRYSGSIPSEKVQSVTITDNPLQRLIGYAGLWVETAGYGPDSNGGSQSAVPLARRERVHTFTENLTGVETPTFQRPPPLARRRYLARYSLLAGLIVLVAFGITQVTIFDRWYLAAVVFLAVPPAAHLRYVHLGYYVGDDHIVIRRGFWKRQTTVIPYYRIQTVSTRRSVFQRRLGLASLVIDTASSRTMTRSAPRIYDIELADARETHQTSRERLQTALRERAAADDPGVSVDFT